MQYRQSRRCEDCGRTSRMEHLNQVEWTFIEPHRRTITWLTLCSKCSRLMALAFDKDPSCELAFHPF